MPYTNALKPFQKVQKLLEWMHTYEPDVTSVYFPEVDVAGHIHGPDSVQVDEQLSIVDNALAMLLDGLNDRGIQANIILVSDHGMAAAEKIIYYEDVIDLNIAKVYDNHPLLEIYVEDPSRNNPIPFSCSHLHWY